MKLILPLSVHIPRKNSEDKVFHLNLNTYRNTHHMTLNQAKVLYKEAVRGALLAKKTANGQPYRLGDRLFADPFLFTYTIFPASKRAFDLGNVCSIVQKFTDDALIDFGLIPDDNYKIVREVRYRFGGVDKESPRAELEIERLGM